MPKVGIVMGSDSDMKVMSKAADMLEKLGVEYEITIISAHREPDVFFEYAKSAEEKDFKVIGRYGVGKDETKSNCKENWYQQNRIMLRPCADVCDL